MGYYTDYTLTASDPEVLLKLKSELCHLNLNDTVFNGSCKWYEHEHDLKDISDAFPNVLFKLEGVGEEQPDLWIKYFLNGQMQVCPAKINFEPCQWGEMEVFAQNNASSKQSQLEEAEREEYKRLQAKYGK